MPMMYTMLLTMVDGKFWNATSETKSKIHWFIYATTSKDFNNLDIINEIKAGSLKYGLSILLQPSENSKSFCIIVLYHTFLSQKSENLRNQQSVLECLLRGFIVLR